MQRSFFLFIGFLALGLGIVGMALPVLPTTPFLLLAGSMFMRSSDRWSDWLFNHRVFGPTIQNYLEHKAVAKQSKVLAMALLWPTIIISVYLVDPLWVKALLILIAIAVSIHVLSLKTIPPSYRQGEYQDPKNE
jgi:hypothetical protein